jgi:hypothetical protein
MILPASLNLPCMNNRRHPLIFVNHTSKHSIPLHLTCDGWAELLGNPRPPTPQNSTGSFDNVQRCILPQTISG